MISFGEINQLLVQNIAQEWTECCSYDLNIYVLIIVRIVVKQGEWFYYLNSENFKVSYGRFDNLLRASHITPCLSQWIYDRPITSIKSWAQKGGSSLLLQLWIILSPRRHGRISPELSTPVSLVWNRMNIFLSRRNF